MITLFYDFYSLSKDTDSAMNVNTFKKYALLTAGTNLRATKNIRVARDEVGKDSPTG